MRIGFVGCGRHASTTLYPAVAAAGLDLVAVCATSVDRARATSDRWGGEPFGSVDSMLDKAELDAVVVCVPAAAYRPIVVAALSAGVHVFCEKPGGAVDDDLAAIESASDAAGVPVMVGYMKRFAPAYRTALDCTRRESFGPITSLHAKFVMGPGYERFDDYVIDNTVHALDILRFFGGEVADVDASFHDAGDRRFGLSALLRFESGAVATAQLGTTASFFQENEALEVLGVGHGVDVRNVDTVTYRPPTGAVERSRPTYTVPLPQNFTGTTMGFVPALEHFSKVVTEGVQCESDVSSARRTLALAQRLLDACR